MEKKKKFGTLTLEEKLVLIKKTKLNIIIKLSFAIIILVLSLIFNNKVSRLATMTATGLFGNEGVAGTKIYFTLISIFLVFLITCYIYLFLLTKKEEKKIDVFGKIYSTYDMMSFILSTIIAFYFVIMFVLTPCTVDGSSMNNTYFNEDRLVVWHLGYNPKTEDVVVIDVKGEHYNNHLKDIFILKRIVGVPNDILEYKPVSINSGDLYINGVFLEDNVSYYQFMVITNDEADDNTYTIPSNRYLAFGDNRKNSSDSRVIGLIYGEDIIGKVIFRIYPFSKMGLPDKNIK